MMRFSMFSRITLAAFLLTFALAPFSLATQIIHRTPQQLGQQSSLVIQGKVTGVRSYWNDKRTKIYTETTVQVDQTYKGTNPGTVRVLQLGGIVGKVKVAVAGALQWKMDEEVVLFLEQATADAYQVSGFSQGKFNVERDPETGQAFLRRPALEGAEVLGAPPDEKELPTSRTTRMPLEQFIDDALNRR
jgi:hypothetical protein